MTAMCDCFLSWWSASTSASVGAPAVIMAGHRKPGCCQVALSVRLHLSEVAPELRQVEDGEQSDGCQLQAGYNLQLAELIWLWRYVSPEGHHRQEALDAMAEAQCTGNCQQALSLVHVSAG